MTDAGRESDGDRIRNALAFAPPDATIVYRCFNTADMEQVKQQLRPAELARVRFTQLFREVP
jgi:hypothetical protein